MLGPWRDSCGLEQSHRTEASREPAALGLGGEEAVRDTELLWTVPGGADHESLQGESRALGFPAASCRSLGAWDAGAGLLQGGSKG